MILFTVNIIVIADFLNYYQQCDILVLQIKNGDIFKVIATGR